MALLLTVLGFTINTEATAYFEDVLGWKKPFATLYITHSSLALPWILHLAYLRLRDRHVPYRTWVRDYNNRLCSAISTIDSYANHGPTLICKCGSGVRGPLDFLATTMAIVTIVLTVSGVSWFLSLSLTTPADLTAIYNCSTFFAAVFSVPILKERIGWFSIIAVALSICGTFTIAYGDTTAKHDPESKIGTSRLFGNLIACVGAVAFGLYEVVFKKWACSSQPISPQASLPLTLAASALTGIYTFATLWVGLVFLHLFQIETFVVPSPYTLLWIIIATLSGSISITLLVILVIWTDPIFGSFANVLSVFFVAIADWLVFGLTPSIATYVGGAVIIVAFGLLAWDTFFGARLSGGDKAP
ncbi:hypothetical protein M433DRAFT_59999 [Acidomyces richmondensis BFW]|nr:MAG: hypothetical protein FE78DRAFT_135510 [Acidomyces sp. 'richmondensis']KYG48984.1 hypothetical protein M433DRAFT_59999 [Acidomyces richmondensis BFW]